VIARRLPLIGYLSALGISTTGTRVSTIAIPWFVLTTTGSATATGVAAMTEMAPLVLLQALSGPVADRLGTRRIALSCNAAGAVIVAIIPLLHWLGQLDFARLLVIVALAGAARGPGEAAQHAMLPAIIKQVGTATERVTGLTGAVERGAGTIGAALAASLIGLLGPAGALVVDAASFGVAFVVLAATTGGIARPTPRPAGVTTYRQDLREGWQFMRGDFVLMGIGVMVALTNLLDQAFSSVLLPVWARDSGHGVAAVSLYGTVAGLAAITGSVVAAAYSQRLPRYWTYLIAFCICGAPRFVVLALGVPIPAVLTVAVAAGFASGFLNPILGAVLFERTPEALIGRVSAMNIAMSWSLLPLGGLLGGVLVSATGLAPALVIVGAGYFAATMLPAVQPRWREMDRSPSPTPG
jgi:MFS family permease